MKKKKWVEASLTGEMWRQVAKLRERGQKAVYRTLHQSKRPSRYTPRLLRDYGEGLVSMCSRKRRQNRMETQK